MTTYRSTNLLNAVYRSFSDAVGLPNFVQRCNCADLLKLCVPFPSLPEYCYGIFYCDSQFYNANLLVGVPIT